MSMPFKSFCLIFLAFLIYIVSFLGKVRVELMKVSSVINFQTFPRVAVATRIKQPFSRMSSTAAFLETTKNRRTYYQINNETTISDSRLREIVKHTILHVPSAFNSQTTRLVVLLKKDHEKLWDIALDVYKSQLPEATFKHTEQRLKGFRAGYGTVHCPMRISETVLN